MADCNALLPLSPTCSRHTSFCAMLPGGESEKAKRGDEEVKAGVMGAGGKGGHSVERGRQT